MIESSGGLEKLMIVPIFLSIAAVAYGINDAIERVSDGEFHSVKDYCQYHLAVATQVDLSDLRLSYNEKIAKYPMLQEF